MHKARAFFFVCAGIFLLALAYHLGAQNATAQTPPGADCVSVDAYTGSAVINRELWWGGPGLEPQKRLGGTVPGTARAVACSPTGVLLENGELWANTDLAWEFVGRFPFSGTTPATQQTWGQLKSRYHPSAPAAPQDK
jgi:hypothetical protein